MVMKTFKEEGKDYVGMNGFKEEGKGYVGMSLKPGN